MRQQYSLTALSEPVTEPVSVAEVKTFLRISHEGDDAVLNNYIRAARMFCENYTGRGFITRSYRVRYDVMPRGSVVSIPKTPLININSVQTGRAGQSPKTVPVEAYTVDVDGGKIRWRLDMNRGEPDTALTIEFTAGYGDEMADIPEALRYAVLLKTAALYENRGSGSVSTALDLVASLLKPYKYMRVA